MREGRGRKRERLFSLTKIIVNLKNTFCLTFRPVGENSFFHAKAESSTITIHIGFALDDN